MKGKEYAQYLNHLNRAANSASLDLRHAHPEEFSRYLEMHMNAYGYVRNPDQSENRRHNWVRKEY
jgi:hypothetical protein